MVTHPHGDRQAAVDVGFLKPALLHDASPLGAQRRCVLTHTNIVKINQNRLYCAG